MAHCWENFDDPRDQIFDLLQAFNRGIVAEVYQDGTADGHGLSTRSPERRSNAIASSDQLQTQCRSLILRISDEIDEAEALEDAQLIRWLGEQKQTLEALLQPAPRCHLMELPGELREAIWIHAVTEWAPLQTSEEHNMRGRNRSASFQASNTILVRRPIRMDRFNRPLPPGLTCVSHQLRTETLALYYQHNIFECWRPVFWAKDWSQSTLIDWLLSLGPRTNWLRDINLLYKHKSELEHDIGQALLYEGFSLQNVDIKNKRELSEYELCFEELGLPRHFGSKRRSDRWLVGAVN